MVRNKLRCCSVTEFLLEASGTQWFCETCSNSPCRVLDHSDDTGTIQTLDMIIGDLLPFHYTELWDWLFKAGFSKLNKKAEYSHRSLRHAMWIGHFSCTNTFENSPWVFQSCLVKAQLNFFSNFSNFVRSQWISETTNINSDKLQPWNAKGTFVRIYVCLMRQIHIMLIKQNQRK